MPEGVSDYAVGGLALLGTGAAGGGVGEAYGVESSSGLGTIISGKAYGRAAGGMGSRKAAPKPMAAPASSPPAPAKAKDKNSSLALQVTASEGLGDVQPLLARLRALLEQRLGRCTTGRPVNLKLRLVLDSARKITAVTLIAGDKALHACLQPSLLNVKSPSRPQGTTGATVELTIVRP